MSGGLRAVATTISGFVLLAAGVVLLILPGPGLLLVLAGLVVLSPRYAWARRLTGPVRARAVVAAQASVDSRWRLAGSILAGFGLVAAGAVWWVDDGLPAGGWASGIGLVVSGIALLVVLAYAWRTYRPHPPRTDPA